MKSKLPRFLLPVIILLAVCFGFGVWVYRTAFSEPPYDPTVAQLASLEMKLQVFHIDTHTLPHTLEGLVTSDGSPNWQGPYAKSEDLTDVWGHPVQYEPLDPSKPSFRLSAVGAHGTAIVSRIYTPDQ